MSSVSTAFKVHYYQKSGDPSAHLGGNAPWPLGEIDAPSLTTQYFCVRGHTYSYHVSDQPFAVIFVMTDILTHTHTERRR